MRALLVRAAANIEGKYAQQPLVEAAVREEIAKAFASVGAFSEAIPQLERTLELRRRIWGAEDPATGQTMHFLGRQLVAAQRFSEAEPVLLEANRVLLAKDRDAWLPMMSLSSAYAGQRKLQDALSWQERASAITERLFGPNASQTVSVRRSAESTRMLIARNPSDNPRVFLVASAVPGTQRLPPAQEVFQRAQGLLAEKKFDQAATVFREALELNRRGDGRATDMPVMLGGLALAYEGQGKIAEAEKLLLEALEVNSKAGSDESRTLLTLLNLAAFYARQRNIAEVSVRLKVLEMERAKGENRPETIPAIRLLGYAYTRHGKYAEVEALYADALAAWNRTQDESFIPRMTALADMYGGLGKFAQAENLLTQVLEARRRFGAAEDRRAITMGMIGWVRLQSGRPAEAETLLRETLAIWDKTDPDAWHRFNTQSVLGATLVAQHKYAEAEALLLSGYEGLKRVPRWPGLLCEFTVEQAGEAVAKFYRDSGQAEKALAWQNRK